DHPPVPTRRSSDLQGAGNDHRQQDDNGLDHGDEDRHYLGREPAHRVASLIPVAVLAAVNGGMPGRPTGRPTTPNGSSLLIRAGSCSCCSPRLSASMAPSATPSRWASASARAT